MGEELNQDAFLFLLAPFTMCLILVGIHCYLGIHVIRRGVIFVDLALAQVAALGTTVAFLFDFEHDARAAYFISLSATLIAAAFFSLSGRMKNRFSPEAIIGVIYAFSAAAIVLVVDKLSHGAEHIKHAMVGQLLWVSWSDVIEVGLIYSVVGAIHYYFRKQLIASSTGESHSIVWDFVFYGLFGVVITSSVKVAGVLIVFAFLVVPALLGGYLYSQIRQQLVFGWLFGFVLSALGLAIAYWLDKPAGALLVVLFTGVSIAFILNKALSPK